MDSKITDTNPLPSRVTPLYHITYRLLTGPEFPQKSLPPRRGKARMGVTSTAMSSLRNLCSAHPEPVEGPKVARRPEKRKYAQRTRHRPPPPRSRGGLRAAGTRRKRPAGAASASRRRRKDGRRRLLPLHLHYLVREAYPGRGQTPRTPSAGEDRYINYLTCDLPAPVIDPLVSLPVQIAKRHQKNGPQSPTKTPTPDTKRPKTDPDGAKIKKVPFLPSPSGRGAGGEGNPIVPANYQQAGATLTR